METYKTVLNLDLPVEVKNFTLEAENLEADFLSDAYFTYQAEPAYFDKLQQHTDFAIASDLNEAMHPVSCKAASFPQDFTYWTRKVIGLVGKRCYSGVYYPYTHYLIYDEATQWVEHFVAGIKD